MTRLTGVSRVDLRAAELGRAVLLPDVAPRVLAALREIEQRHGKLVAALGTIETGRTQPRPSTLRRIAAALDVEPSTLLPDDPAESA